MSSNYVFGVIGVLFLAFLLGYALYKMVKQDYGAHEK